MPKTCSTLYYARGRPFVGIGAVEFKKRFCGPRCFCGGILYTVRRSPFLVAFLLKGKPPFALCECSVQFVCASGDFPLECASRALYSTVAIVPCTQRGPNARAVAQHTRQLPRTSSQEVKATKFERDHSERHDPRRIDPRTAESRNVLSFLISTQKS